MTCRVRSLAVVISVVAGLLTHSPAFGAITDDALISIACISDISFVGVAKSTWLNNENKGNCPDGTEPKNLEQYANQQPNCWKLMATVTVLKPIKQSATFRKSLAQSITLSIANAPSDRPSLSLSEYAKSLIGVSMLYQVHDYSWPYYWHLGYPISGNLAGALSKHVQEKCPAQRVP